jgi:hypothetical protein
MYLRLRKGKLKEIISKAIRKAGNLRKLEKEIGIPRTNLFQYHHENWIIRKDRLENILNYLKIKLQEDDIIETLPHNWRQIKGGKRGVEIKKEKGIYEEQLRICRSKNTNTSLKLWHKKMKKENPEKYYLMQYEKFKKIGSYKFTTLRGERVRNSFEKQVADILFKNKINYKYEPLVKSNNKYFFPDFLIDDKIIIECTEWRGFDKAIKLKDKIKHLEVKYNVYVIIPKALKRYYEILNKYLLFETDELIETIMKSR